MIWKPVKRLKIQGRIVIGAQVCRPFAIAPHQLPDYLLIHIPSGGVLVCGSAEHCKAFAESLWNENPHCWNFRSLASIPEAAQRIWEKLIWRQTEQRRLERRRRR